MTAAASVPRRPPLLAVVILSTCVGLVGGALAAWAMYARFGPVERVVTQPITVNGSGGGLSVGAVAQQAEASVVMIATHAVTPGSLLDGSAPVADGFIVSADGLVVTSIHALRGATSLSVATGDGHRYAATIVGTDALHGVVLLRASGASGLTPLRFASSPAAPGDVTIAVARAPLFPTILSTGIVSSTGRSLQLADGEPQLADVLTVDATADPREDGAPLLSGAGDVVGVVVDASGAAPGVVALSGRAAGLLAQQSGATQGTPSLGATSVIVDPASAALSAVPQGALLRSVTAGGPAAAAGLEVGDVVTSVNGTPIGDAHPFDAVALGLTVDQAVTVVLWRAGATQSVILTVGSAATASG